MSEKKVEDNTLYCLLLTFCLFIVPGPIKSKFCAAGEPNSTGINIQLDAMDPDSLLQDEQQEQPEAPKALMGIWDPNKYISVDEIQPEMEAYCLTCYTGTAVEKFGLEIVSVVHNIEPGRDAILVQGTDERFIHTGPVGGCSGSPVYINGRLAGALAFAWYFSKDPLYGVTPIKEMLEVGQFDSHKQDATQAGFVFDFSEPIDLAEIDKQITNSLLSKSNRPTGVSPLPCPLITSGLPTEACKQLEALVEPFGLMVVNGISSNRQQETTGQDVSLEPGAVLTIPLVGGDIRMFVLGTATEIIDDKVYGFGHSFLGRGPVDLPMATGKVHTVMSSLTRSFKLGSTLDIVGALTADETAAIVGQIGKQSKLIPLTIKVDRYNDSQERIYNCQVASDQTLTPVVLASAVNAAVFYLGDFPPDHTVEYKIKVKAEQAEPIIFENVSTGVGITDMLVQSKSLVALLMNNPFKEVDIESLDFEIRILPENIVSHIWSVNLLDPKVKAGETIKAEVVIESFLAGKKKYQLSMKIPEDTPPGAYDLAVCGPQGYAQFLKKAVAYRFLAQGFDSMIEAINKSLEIKHDKLYCILTLPASGIALEKAELPDLPATKALVLQSEKRTLRSQLYQHWLEEHIETNTINIDKKVVRVIVEK